MGNVNLLLQIPIDQLPIYFISIFVMAIIGIAMTEWFDKRFERFIEPLCKRISNRRAMVMEKERKAKHKDKRKKSL